MRLIARQQAPSSRMIFCENGSCRTLCARPISNLDDLFTEHLLDECQHFSFTALAIHRKLLKQDIDDGRNSDGLLNQGPDTVADRLRTVILSIFDAENR